MPTLATGQRAIPRPTRPGGFTLLEVLIVVLITGIVLSLATLAIRDNPERRLRTEAQRFAALVTLAAQEAVLQSREVAVELQRDGYRFLILDDGEWVEPADNVFRQRSLPEGMELSVTVEGEDPATQQRGTRRDPRIYVLSGGEMTPFELSVRQTDRGAAYRVRGDAGGRLALGD